MNRPRVFSTVPRGSVLFDAIEGLVGAQEEGLAGDGQARHVLPGELVVCQHIELLLAGPDDSRYAFAAVEVELAVGVGGG